MFSVRNRLMVSDECGLSNEYLGCLNALVATGCVGRVAELRFQDVAPYLLGSAACRDRYDFARPAFAFAYDNPTCVPRFQEMLQKIRDDFLNAVGDPFVRGPYPYPVLMSGSSQILRNKICP
uniref:AAA_lid_11 domain-containing protein n=1 Tax=Macrostomum lignano TaxID=282301 RepID=A0A1I8GJI3_9PLAT